jgi:hypothetical protein
LPIENQKGELKIEKSFNYFVGCFKKIGATLDLVNAAVTIRITRYGRAQ